MGGDTNMSRVLPLHTTRLAVHHLIPHTEAVSSSANATLMTNRSLKQNLI